MKLEYSPVAKIPQIILDENNRLSFSNPGGSKIGYAWLIYSGRGIQGGKFRNKSFEVLTNVSFIFKVDFSDLKLHEAESVERFDKKIRQVLKKEIVKYLIEYKGRVLFPFEKLDSLAKELEDYGS